MSEGFSISKQQLAYMLGVDVRSITKYQNDKTNPLPVSKKGKRGTSNHYDPHEVMRWYVDHQVAKRIKVCSEDGVTETYDKDSQQARLYKEQADNTSLKNAQLRKEVAPIEILEWVLVKAGGQITSLLEAIPLKVKRRVPKLSASDVDIMKKEIVKALNIISRLRIDLDEYESDH